MLCKHLVVTEYISWVEWLVVRLYWR